MSQRKNRAFDQISIRSAMRLFPDALHLASADKADIPQSCLYAVRNKVFGYHTTASLFQHSKFHCLYPFIFSSRYINMPREPKKFTGLYVYWFCDAVSSETSAVFSSSHSAESADASAVSPPSPAISSVPASESASSLFLTSLLTRR